MSVQKLLAALEGPLEFWAEAKFAFEQSIPVGDAWIHVIAGPVIMVLAALVMRRRVASWGPWLVVLLLISVNEWLDLVLAIWPRREPQYGDSVSDFVLTMAIPTLLLMIARFSEIARERKSTKRRVPQQGR